MWNKYYLVDYIEGDKMRIMGIDPGVALTGFAVVDFACNHFTVIEYGCIRTESGLPLPQRLYSLYLELRKVIKRLKPTQFALEELFFNRNNRTALTVGQARGVILLAAAEASLSIHEYTPLQIKQGVTGYGRAGKQQVRYMVRALLDLPEIPQLDDISDALAVAICHAFNESSLLASNKGCLR